MKEDEDNEALDLIPPGEAAMLSYIRQGLQSIDEQEKTESIEGEPTLLQVFNNSLKYLTVLQKIGLQFDDIAAQILHSERAAIESKKNFLRKMRAAGESADARNYAAIIGQFTKTQIEFTKLSIKMSAEVRNWEKHSAHFIPAAVFIAYAHAILAILAKRLPKDGKVRKEITADMQKLSRDTLPGLLGEKALSA
jgi:hypothetical protein